MFEASFMESGNRIKAKNKYWSIVSLLLKGAVLVALILWPLLGPEALHTEVMAALLVAPPTCPPPPPMQATPEAPIQPESLSNQLQAPSKIKTLKEQAPAFTMDGVQRMEGLADGEQEEIDTILGSVGTRPAIVRRGRSRTLSISSGVMAGDLLDETVPQYPAIAKAGRIRGIVVLQGTISETGVIRNVRVISGPPMLQQAAVDAVRSRHYKPYLLNGNPVEVETTVSVVFNVGE